jgi:hypothetical protein
MYNKSVIPRVHYDDELISIEKYPTLPTLPTAWSLIDYAMATRKCNNCQKWKDIHKVLDKRELMAELLVPATILTIVPKTIPLSENNRNFKLVVHHMPMRAMNYLLRLHY